MNKNTLENNICKYFGNHFCSAWNYSIDEILIYSVSAFSHQYSIEILVSRNSVNREDVKKFSLLELN